MAMEVALLLHGGDTRFGVPPKEVMTARTPAEVRTWRPGVVRGASHEYVVRRAIADSVSASLLRLPVTALPEHLSRVRSRLARVHAAEISHAEPSA